MDREREVYENLQRSSRLWRQIFPPEATKLFATLKQTQRQFDELELIHRQLAKIESISRQLPSIHKFLLRSTSASPRREPEERLPWCVESDPTVPLQFKDIYQTIVGSKGRTNSFNLKLCGVWTYMELARTHFDRGLPDL